MIVLIFSFNLSDIANYYKNIQINENFEMTLYKSNLSRIRYKILGSYYESKEKTIYYGYLPNGSEVKMEFNGNNYDYSLDGNIVEAGFLDIPVFSPYKIFSFLYENHYPYNAAQKDGILYVVFNTDGDYWSFSIRLNDYRIIEYLPPLKLKIDFK